MSASAIRKYIDETVVRRGAPTDTTLERLAAGDDLPSQATMAAASRPTTTAARRISREELLAFVKTELQPLYDDRRVTKQEFAALAKESLRYAMEHFDDGDAVAVKLVARDRLIQVLQPMGLTLPGGPARNHGATGDAGPHGTLNGRPGGGPPDRHVGAPVRASTVLSFNRRCIAEGPGQTLSDIRATLLGALHRSGGGVTVKEREPSPPRRSTVTLTGRGLPRDQEIIGMAGSSNVGGADGRGVRGLDHQRGEDNSDNSSAAQDASTTSAPKATSGCCDGARVEHGRMQGQQSADRQGFTEQRSVRAIEKKTRSIGDDTLPSTRLNPLMPRPTNTIQSTSIDISRRHEVSAAAALPEAQPGRAASTLSVANPSEILALESLENAVRLAIVEDHAMTWQMIQSFVSAVGGGRMMSKPPETATSSKTNNNNTNDDFERLASTLRSVETQIRHFCGRIGYAHSSRSQDLPLNEHAGANMTELCTLLLGDQFNHMLSVSERRVVQLYESLRSKLLSMANGQNLRSLHLPKLQDDGFIAAAVEESCNGKQPIWTSTARSGTGQTTKTSQSRSSSLKKHRYSRTAAPDRSEVVECLRQELQSAYNNDEFAPDVVARIARNAAQFAATDHLDWKAALRRRVQQLVETERRRAGLQREAASSTQRWQRR